MESPSLMGMARRCLQIFAIHHNLRFLAKTPRCRAYPFWRVKTKNVWMKKKWRGYSFDLRSSNFTRTTWPKRRMPTPTPSPTPTINQGWAPLKSAIKWGRKHTLFTTCARWTRSNFIKWFLCLTMFRLKPKKMRTNLKLTKRTKKPANHKCRPNTIRSNEKSSFKTTKRAKFFR